MSQERKRIVITGAAGRLGATLVAQLRAAGYDVAAYGRAELDVTSQADVERLPDARPDAIINCSAYNAVDKAETEADAAFAINAHGPLLLARIADRIGVPIVHYSTDFVFDGNSDVPYREDDEPNPLSVYGASKLAGEQHVRAVTRHYILRVESLFGGTGVHGHRTTVDVITDNLVAGGPVRALVDRTTSLSHVGDVVRATRALLEQQAPFGIYHCVCSGHSTWYELACEIRRQVASPATIERLFASDLKSAARRPTFCALSNHKLRDLGIDLPPWQTTIAQHLGTRGISLVGNATR